MVKSRAFNPNLLGFKARSGFTLLELVVALAVSAILMLGASMSATYWNTSTDLMTAKSSLSEGYMRLRAMALRNPQLISDSSAASSTLTLNASTNTLLLCPGGSGCSTPAWSSPLPTGVQIALAGEALNCIALNSSGQLVSGSGGCNTGGNGYSISAKGVVLNGNF